MAYEIKFAATATEEWRDLRAYDQRRIVDEVERTLRHEPAKQAKNRKCLSDLIADFEFVPPLWELRVGEFRIFYDVDAEAQVVNVRTVRRKTRGMTTEDIT